MAEQVRENINSLTESLLSDSLEVNGSSLALFDDSLVNDSSINTDDSVFGERVSSEGVNRDLNFTKSVTDDVENNAGARNISEVLTRCYNTGERRFERGIGSNHIGNDIIKFSPCTNAELSLNDSMIKNIFSVKDISVFADNEIEIFIDEVTKITNSEVIFTDKLVRIYFPVAQLNDPSLFNEQLLEEAKLGSYAHYRNKIMQATLQYLSTLQKWCVLRDGTANQKLPTFVPGRDYLSSSRARSLKVPYNKKEALLKYDLLTRALESQWISDRKWNKEQAELVTDLLLLGAYSLPKIVLTSPLLDLHIRDVMQKELLKCFDEIKKGFNCRIPCRGIFSILADYLRVSSDHLPYCFLDQMKSVAYATSNASDDPMSTVRLHARNGSKDYKVFTFHTLLMDTGYPNIYFGLNVMKYGYPIWDVLGHWRMGKLPPFTVVQAAGQPSGIVATPPPYYLINYGPSLPTPKGQAHVCIVEIRNRC